MIKQYRRLITLLAGICLLTACTNNAADRMIDGTLYDVNDGRCPLNLDFRYVDASVFTFNETPTGRLIDGAEVPVEVVQKEFWIGTKPVTPEVYEHFLHTGWPANGLSRDDADKLLDAIYKETGYAFHLPTEAQFEAAVNGGILKPGKKDEYLTEDYWSDRPEPEGMIPKRYYETTNGISIFPPKEPGKETVIRSLYERRAIENYRRRQANIVLLTLNARPKTISTVPGNRAAGQTSDTVAFLTAAMTCNKPDATNLSDNRKETVTVNGASFEMLPVLGGMMTLGGTPEQEKYADEDEYPVREATVRDFKLSRTEVTVWQWMAVMGELPYGNDRRYPQIAVCNVSWYDAVEFTLKLRQLTGKPFRLPTEDEWEYAARGGERSRRYIFSGSNNAADVAVCTRKNKDGESVYHHQVNVASLKANELGFHDMSGNMWEWCRTVHPDGGAIQKGGSWKSLNTACRVSNRQAMSQELKKETFGFRIAL